MPNQLRYESPLFISLLNLQKWSGIKIQFVDSLLSARCIDKSDFFTIGRPNGISVPAWMRCEAGPHRWILCTGRTVCRGCRKRGHLQAGVAGTQTASKPNPLSRGIRTQHAEKRASMTWAQRLKRVFNIEIETCNKCGGDVRIIASIEEPGVIQKILAHLDNIATTVATGLLPFR